MGAWTRKAVGAPGNHLGSASPTVRVLALHTLLLDGWSLIGQGINDRMSSPKGIGQLGV